jgi:hypothetical protein
VRGLTVREVGDRLNAIFNLGNGHTFLHYDTDFPSLEEIKFAHDASISALSLSAIIERSRLQESRRRANKEDTMSIAWQSETRRTLS